MKTNQTKKSDQILIPGTLQVQIEDVFEIQKDGSPYENEFILSDEREPDEMLGAYYE
jgi:hypothetical protein